MKKCALILLTVIRITLAQNSALQSGVYCRDNAALDQGIVTLLKGTTQKLALLQVDVIALPAGSEGEMNVVDDSAETLLIIKQGTLNVRLNEKHQSLGQRSIVMIMPADTFQCQNTGTDTAIVYSLKFKSHNSPDMIRADSCGGSFTVDFNTLEFKPHDKGGRYDYYNRPTAMFPNAEMHVTRLNPQIKSHEPHTHGADEIVLMISGNSKMQIGEKFCTASAGDFYYMESGVAHAIQNTTEEPCMYFAFQWQ